MKKDKDIIMDVSVCLITYNHKKYIAKALESILMQQASFQWEIIIADDCSTDGTSDIIKEYQSTYPDLIHVLNRPVNVGPGKNFCELIDAAKGKYIAYLEGDDFWIDENKLQKQYDLMQANPEFSMCYHQIHWVDDVSNEINYNFISNETDKPVTSVYDIFEKGWYIRSCTMFFKNIGLPKDFEKLYVGDYPLHILLADKGPIGFIKEPMGVYRSFEGVSDTQLSNQLKNKVHQNFTKELFLFDYLNRETNKKYHRIFEIKKFNAIKGYLKFIAKSHPISFLPAAFSIVRKNGLLFVLKNLFRKEKYPLNANTN